MTTGPDRGPLHFALIVTDQLEILWDSVLHVSRARCLTVRQFSPTTSQFTI